jgi:hypothetical protein
MLFLLGAGTSIQSENTSGNQRRNWDLNAERQMLILHHLTLPPRSSKELRSSGLLRGKLWQFLTDVSGQRIGCALENYI